MSSWDGWRRTWLRCIEPSKLSQRCWLPGRSWFGSRFPSTASGPWSDVQALDGLVGDGGDEVEVLVSVQHGEPGEFRRGRDQQVRD